MKRMRALPRGLGLLVAITSLGVAQTPAPKSATADLADFETVCGACHNTSLISDVRTEPEWEDTVEHMVSIGAKGTDDQLRAVMRVLLRKWTKVNINTAAVEQLPLVLDISEAAAQALVKYRNAHGNFKSLDDLKKVPGLIAAKLEARKDRIAY
jgi:competence protein ComEA